MSTTRFCLEPRLAADTHFIARLSICQLRLMDDANYPWLILIPEIAAARELTDLSVIQSHALMDDIARASHVLLDLHRPLKLNVATLGNIVSQLHLHVIARFENDPAWPTPVWGRVAPIRYSAERLADRLHTLRVGLAN